MFFYWGTRRNDKRLGYVADFCPVCCDIKPFDLCGLRLVFHLYGLNLGDGKPLGIAEVCQQCGLWQGADPNRFQSIQSQIPEGITRLIERTLPNVSEIYETRLNQEERIQRSPFTLSPFDRETLVKEAFLACGQHAQIAARSVTSKPAWSIVFALLFDEACNLLRLPSFLLQPMITVVTLVCLALAVIFWLVDATKKIADPCDLLLAALVPLEPSPEEIDAAMRHTEVSALKPWNRIPPAEVKQWISVLKNA